MYVVSEITGKKYDTVEECLADEKQIKEDEKMKKGLLDEAFTAVKAYLDKGGEFSDIAEMFGYEKICRKQYDKEDWAKFINDLFGV